MPAKKPTKKLATGSEETKPAQTPLGTPHSSEASQITPTETVPQKREPERPGPPVAGMGASAGGLDAFKKFFTVMPPDSGIAFVLVPHLDPAQESLMVELLARHTTMPVVEAENDMPVKANHVYIIPPNKFMTIRDGFLRLTGPVQRHTSQTSIDLFLRSLADDQQERSIGILLSGTGTHGTLGLKAIKAASGMVMIQDPATAQCEQMPRSAVAAGLADYVLPVELMPENLLKYVHHAYVNRGTPIETGPEAADHLTQVLALLRTRTKFDFRGYRKKMLTRRIERRMGLSHLDSIPDYLSFLRKHPQEVKQLVKDLLIGVTSFFRDPEAFELLANQVIAPLVQRKEADAAIRVWVPGCAMGEEAYVLAMLLKEQLAVARKSCRVQVFATDVDGDAVDVARQALYPDSIAADLTPERLTQFFTKVDDHTYQVNKSLRDMIIFAVQNLLSDPPFSKLDLISCRNLLIYLEPEVQKKVVTLFHFALVEGGFLFLGPAETIGRQIDLFETLSKKWRIFRRIGPARPERVDFPIMAATEAGGAKSIFPKAGGMPPLNFAELTHQLLLEQLAPAAVLINRKYEVLYYFGPCTRYLEFPTGEPTHDVTRMAREGLSTRLRGAIHRAVQDNQDMVLNRGRVKRDGSYSPVRVTVRPIQAPKAAEGLLLIIFEEEARDEAVLRQLEDELNVTRADLQGTIEEMERSNEELKASNEEILSMNEELQSANEELEASNEEIRSINEEMQSANEELEASRTKLQSLNEELGTVNSQLQDKVKELASANNDMTNLLNCTDVATIFLDRAFRLKLFTPAAAKLFHVLPADLGRPLGDITAHFDDPDLLRDAQQVLQHLTPQEKEVSTAEGVWWVRRITVYRTQDNRIDGVVITFVDITERKKATDFVVRRLAAIVENSIDAIFSKDLDGVIQTWNRGAERLYGYTAEEAVGQSVRMLVPEDRIDEWYAIVQRLRCGESVERLETERVRKDGQRIPVALTVSPLRDHSGKVVSASTIVRDIRASKQAEQALRESERRFRLLFEKSLDAILVADDQGRYLMANEAACRLLGYSLDELLGMKVADLRLSQGANAGELYQSYVTRGEQFGEFEFIRPDGQERVAEYTAIRLTPGQHMSILRDVTERRRAEEMLRQSEARLRAILDSTVDAIITIDHQGIIQSVNPGAERMFGYAAAEMVGQNVAMLMPSPYRGAHNDYIARYLQTGEKHIIGITRETVAQRKNGSVFEVDLTVSEIPHLNL